MNGCLVVVQKRAIAPPSIPEEHDELCRMIAFSGNGAVLCE
jgi:hypothetical protein